ncbi:protein unc-93 homolog A isoform X1 [Dipodomys merriami]|uniref:protein unc-93 homolog A isoform X1 n=1 Tax=Dipodomys merriami TaxID=94247 RepID=UPI0038556BD6
MMQSSLRNVLVISFGFLLLFTAFGGLQNLQSSLYNEDGLGVATLSSLYGAVLLSSMLLPPILIKRCGCKWTIVGSMCCYVAFSLGNFQASWFSLIPTSVLLGLGAAPLWSAQCTYLTVAGSRHAERTGQLGRDVVNQYFGIFFLIFQSSGVWGNLISSLVFGQTPTKESILEKQLESCGARDCLMVSAASNSTQGPSRQLIYTLLSIYTVSGVLAILLIAVFLEPLEDFEPNGKGKDGKPPPFWTTLLSTFRLLGDGRLRLLVLLPLYSGLQQGFISVLHHLCPGHPLRGLRDDLLLRGHLPVLAAVREALAVLRPGRHLRAGRSHPPVLHRHAPAVAPTANPDERLLPPPRPVGPGGRRLADTEQCSVWRSVREEEGSCLCQLPPVGSPGVCHRLWLQLLSVRQHQAVHPRGRPERGHAGVRGGGVQGVQEDHAGPGGGRDGAGGGGGERTVRNVTNRGRAAARPDRSRTAAGPQQGFVLRQPKGRPASGQQLGFPTIYMIFGFYVMFFSLTNFQATSCQVRSSL